MGLARFFGQACCDMGLDWLTADRMQVAIYLSALVVAVVRLLVIWTIGWRSNSGSGTVVVRLTSRGRDLDSERPQYAVSCPAHSDAYRVPNVPEAMSYLGLRHLAVIPDRSGTRHWTPIGCSLASASAGSGGSGGVSSSPSCGGFGSRTSARARVAETNLAVADQQ